MLSGEKLALLAMKKEFNRLSRKVETLTNEYNERLNVGSEMLSIHNDFVKIVKSGDMGKSAINALDVLKKRSTKTEKIRKKDFMKLIDKQFNAEMERDSLGYEIQRMEFRHSIRNT